MPAKSVESLLEDIRFVSESHHATVQAVRALVRQHVKAATEAVKYGGIVFTAGVPFGGVYAYKDHVTVEFSQGAAIADPFGHLEGTGKGRRHVKLTSLADVKGKKLAQYLPLAVAAAGGG